MFADDPAPRLFGLPPGADFGRALVQGLRHRWAGLAPEQIARISIIVNTRRMQRRLTGLLQEGGPALLPRIRVLSDLSTNPVAGLPPPVSPLRRRLEVTTLVSALLDQDPDLAPRAALYDLSDSLVGLMAEMQGEGVGPDRLAQLDIADVSGHWARTLAFLGIVDGFFDRAGAAPDPDTRLRRVIEDLARSWADTPPADPVIVAGSTGSRGAASLLMRAVLTLPQGAVVLPGVDFDMPRTAWDALADRMGAEDHPQYRFADFAWSLDHHPRDIAAWMPNAAASPARNRLVSLSLRPAPVTDAWLREGPALTDLAEATAGLTLVEAPSPRSEAETIALRLRRAIEDGQSAALITPDRTLTRQVAAALDRWNIIPDDSAGLPLQLSPPGRFLRQIGALMRDDITAEALLSLLKHPLCHSGGDGRGDHLRWARLLELRLRRAGPPFPAGADLRDWASSGSPERQLWAAWIADGLGKVPPDRTAELSEHLSRLLDLAEHFAGGAGATGAGGLWDEGAGREARRLIDDLRRHADAAGPMPVRDAIGIIDSVLAQGEVRNRDAGHPLVRIWGTLEARVQSADLMILAGMNEGTWPEAAAPDPWLNRTLRYQAGLLLPERRIGLSAHDYQQAVGAPDVWITRAIRSSEAETVPSRWVNRLTNLLQGLPGGQEHLDSMRARGRHWVETARTLGLPSSPTAPAARPSPRPPVATRPDSFSVTQIKTLIRDPFAIYARKVLRLKRLDPLVHVADAPLRGILVHDILERFVNEGMDPADPAARDRLMAITDRVLDAECPWPTMRRLWRARFYAVADWFLAGEVARRARGTPLRGEIWGEIETKTGIRLTGRADRMDVTDSGAALIYDYKTGTPPTANVQKAFDKQLLLEAAMVERGAFDALGPRPVAGAEFIGLGSDPKVVPAPLTDEPPDKVWAQLESLFERWSDQGRGYSARMALQSRSDASDYDHLSRFGEWDITDPATPEDLS